MVILIAICTFFSTLIGGISALKLKDKLHLVLGFSAGAVIAVAFFDLLPEAASLGNGYYSISTITSVAALGFLVYLTLDRVIFLHAHDHGVEEAEREQGILGASSLSVHSFLDGVAIGLAFQVSTSIGLVVAVAVLVHDFSDGINTVSIILKHRGQGVSAMKWLIVDAVAPIFGAASTLFFSLPENALALVLATFSGFFLFIGASDLIPESEHAHPKFMTTAMTLLGAGVLYVAIRLAQG